MLPLIVAIVLKRNTRGDTILFSMTLLTDSMGRRETCQSDVGEAHCATIPGPSAENARGIATTSNNID